MGQLIIHTSENIEEEYCIDNLKILEKIKNILQKESASLRTEKEIKCKNIVGIWKDRFDKNVSSGSIERKWRNGNWKESGKNS